MFLLKEYKNILFFAPLFYSFQNLVVHPMALTIAPSNGSFAFPLKQRVNKHILW
jgi:hypothetical protein